MISAKPLEVEGSRVLVKGFSGKCGKTALIHRIAAGMTRPTIVCTKYDTYFRYVSSMYRELGKELPYILSYIEDNEPSGSPTIYKNPPADAGVIEDVFYIVPPLLQDHDLGISDKPGVTYRALVRERLTKKYMNARIHLIEETEARLKSDDLFFLQELDWLALRELERIVLSESPIVEARLILRDSSIKELENTTKFL